MKSAKARLAWKMWL